MNRRERTLAIAVGSLGALFALWYGFEWFQSSLNTRQTQLETVQKKLNDAKRTVRKGQQAAQKLVRFEQQSLPSNLERSQSLYQKWLLDLVQRHQLADSTVNATAGRVSKGVYHQFTFSVKGRASLAQVTRIMHDFYAVDRLHRIRRLRLKPVPDSTDVDVDLLVEVLALATAPDATELKHVPSQRLQHGSSDDYVKALTERNFFGPPHQAPTIANTASSKYELGKMVSFSVKGNDPEKRPVSYTIDKSNISGGELDPKLGTFIWKPTEKGDYEMTVRVTDGGVPPKSVTQTIKFAVVDPPPPEVVVERPPPPKFDNAKYTYLSAVLDVDGQPEAWLIVRTTGQTLKLQPGEKFDVGTLQGTILEISGQEIEIETADGQRSLISIGQTLRDGLVLPPGDI